MWKVAQIQGPKFLFFFVRIAVLIVIIISIRAYPCGIFKRYLYSAKSSWIIRGEISPSVTDVSLPSLNENNLNNLQIRSQFGVFFVFHKVKSIEKYK